MVDSYNRYSECNGSRMSRLKSRALCLLLVLVLQTIGPAFACAVPALGSAKHACCRQMATDCGSAMGGDPSCCRMDRSQTPTEPGTVFSVENGHELNYVAVAAAPRIDSSAASVWRAVSSAPPPDTSPSNSSVLRI